MKRKSGLIRANEFALKQIVRKKFGTVTLDINQIRKLTLFFENWLAENSAEPTDSLYVTVGRLLFNNPNSDDLYGLYQQLKNYKVHTFEHNKILFGVETAATMAGEISKIRSSNRKISKNNYVDSFLKKKCVSHTLKKENLSNEQLAELTLLLTSKEYSEFNDNESIIIDLVLNFEKDFINRYNIIKSNPSSSWEYYKARYADNAKNKFLDYKSKKSLNAKRNFKNCPEYWLMQGLSIKSSEELSLEVQKTRAQKAKSVLIGRIGPRSIDYWISKGYSVEDSKFRVYEIQRRDAEWFKVKYGDEIGNYEFEKTIQKRLTTWYSRSEESRKSVNQSRGRTYHQLVTQYGLDIANNIIRSRTSLSTPISQESKDFFEKLDKLLPTNLSVKSITGYKGPERWFNIGGKFYFVDYIIGNVIIEYNGSYWHADPRLFEEEDWHSGTKKQVKEIWNYDRSKLDDISKLGYNILGIWSLDVKDNIHKQLTKCKEFIINHVK